MCNVSLVVADDQCLPGGSDSTTVSIQDTTPPVIQCNPPATAHGALGSIRNFAAG
jgi:hypothetical protein